MPTSSFDELLMTASADTFWMPDDVHVVERDAIKYTYSERDGALYNCVLFSRGDASVHLALLDEVARAHQHKPSRWTLTPSNDSPQLRDLLSARGYEAGHVHHAYVIACDAYDRAAPEDIQVAEVDSVAMLRTLYRLHDVCFGSTHALDDEELERELTYCIGADRRVARLVAMRDGVPAGLGGMTMHREHGLAMIWAGGVHPEHRGHGVYTALLAARAKIARAANLTHLALYARHGTSAPIVAAHGFERHGLMTHFMRP